MVWSKCLDSVLVKMLHYQCTIKTRCFHSVLVECFGHYFFQYGKDRLRSTRIALVAVGCIGTTRLIKTLWTEDTQGVAMETKIG